MRQRLPGLDPAEVLPEIGEDCGRGSRSLEDIVNDRPPPLGLATTAGGKGGHRRRVDRFLTPPGRLETLLDDSRIDRQTVPPSGLLIGHSHRWARLDERAHHVEHHNADSVRRKHDA